MTRSAHSNIPQGTTGFPLVIGHRPKVDSPATLDTAQPPGISKPVIANLSTKTNSDGLQPLGGSMTLTTSNDGPLAHEPGLARDHGKGALGISQTPTASNGTRPEQIGRDGISAQVRRNDPQKPEADRTKDFGFYDFDVQSGQSAWSPSLQRMLLQPGTDQISAETIHDSIHPDDRNHTAARMAEVTRRAGPFELIYRVILPDGRTIVVRDRGEAHAPVDPVTGSVARVTGTLSDITPAAPIEPSQKLANDAFWQLVDTAPLGAYAVDADLRMVRINRSGMAAFAEIDNLLGRSLDEVLHILWPEPFASDAVAQFQETLDTGQPHHADPVIDYRADRNVLEAYDWSVERVTLDDGQRGVLCYFYDLSERVRNERALEEQRLRLSLAYEAAELGAWEVDLKTGRVSGTPQLAAILGEPDFNGDFADLWNRRIHPEDADAAGAAFSAAARGEATLDIDFRIVLPDGEVRHLSAKGTLIRDADGRALRMIGVDQDITDRKMAEMAAHANEGRLRRVLDHTLAFIGVLDPAGCLQEVNRPAIEFGGLKRDDVLGRPFWEAFWWTHDPDIADRCRLAVQDGQAGQMVRYDVMVRGADDKLITIDFMLAPVFDDAGDLTMMVVSGSDISDREDARARERALMGEINHRTKNILTLVQVVARQTARGGAIDFVSRFEKRIGALAKAQDLLFHSNGDRVDLRDLARSQLGHLRDLGDNRIKLSGPDVSMGPQAAQAIGMALHELATNAAKYGALSSNDGHVDVTWSLDQISHIFNIVWSEHDGPPVVPPESKGFGSTVIDQMAGSVLDADVCLDYAPDGVRWELTCGDEQLSIRAEQHTLSQPEIAERPLPSVKDIISGS